MKSSTTTRRAVTTLAMLSTAVAGVALPAQAAPREATATDERLRQIEQHGFGQVAAPIHDPGGEGRVEASAITAARCPLGAVTSRTSLREGFEGGLPDGGIYSSGWSLDDQDPGAGAQSALTYQHADFYEDIKYVFMEDAFAVRGARTYLSFLVDGVSGAENVGFWANDEGWTLVLDDSGWGRVTVDVTAATTTFADGYVEIGFGSLHDPAVDTLVRLDDVSLFSCAPAAASGVRGDWSGEGSVDVLGVTGEGALYHYPGLGNGRVGSGTQVGNGWEGMTWMGSPGDVNGDRRTDLVARRSDGALFLYAGRGGGGFGSAVQVGSSWNGMTALTAAGDLSGDGRPDLLARRADGALFRYTFTTAGRLTSAQQIGSGWNATRWLIGVDDLDGDRVSDVLAIHSSGDLYAYRGSATGLRSMGKVGSGWGSMTWVSSPGDMNRDGRGDVVGRSITGALYFYAGKLDGLRGGVEIGTGWGGIDRIL